MAITVKPNVAQQIPDPSQTAPTKVAEQAVPAAPQRAQQSTGPAVDPTLDATQRAAAAAIKGQMPEIAKGVAAPKAEPLTQQHAQQGQTQEHRLAAIRDTAQTIDFSAGLEAQLWVNSPSELAGKVQAKPVRRAFEYYQQHVEDEDWGSVRLYKLEQDGAECFAVYTSTDGDDGFLELYTLDGQAIASAGTMCGQVESWDAEFGAVRANVHYD